MMMKQTTLKIFAILLALVMLFALASCGSKDKQKDNSATTGITKNTDKEKYEDEIITENDNQAQKATVVVETTGSNKDGSAKSGGKDTGKDSGKSSGSSDKGKQTGGNSSETSKPSGGQQSGGQQSGGKTSLQEEKGNESELIVPEKEIQLPIVPLE